MSEKLKVKLIELSTYILIIIFIIALYKIYTKPVNLYDVINNGSIKSIFVRIIINDINDYEVPDEQDIKLGKSEDIDEFMILLNNYEYSKIPKFYNDRVFPVNNSDVTLDCVINFDDNKILHQQVQVYSDNEVTMYNKNGKYRDYVVKGNEDKLFEELLTWINERHQEEKNTESETVIQDYFTKNNYELIDSDVAEIISYDYKNKSMYIAGLKVFKEFSTEEFGFSNEGSVSIITDDNVLRFSMTTATGTTTGAVDGPYVYFKMDLDTNEIIDKRFEPAPDYIKWGKTEFIKHSGEKIELTDERMAEIGLYFKELIEEIEAKDEL